MKKTFRSILAGALSLLAVSCYDDSAIQEQLRDHEDRLSSIEATLNAEVGGVNDLVSRIEALEGQIAAINVETENGVTTLTLSNGNSVILSKDGVVTIDENGEWATVAADGTVTSTGVKVGHELDFKVENGELKYAPKGSAEFVATGVKISDYTAHVIGNVVPAEDGKSVAVTIGSQTLELPLVTSAVASLGLSRDSFFLRYSGEKTITITAENLADVYVMNEPDGWKASIDGSDLKVVAPSKKALEVGAAAEEGLVLVHATTAEGKCIVAKLEVSACPGLTMTVDTQGNVVIENAYTSLQWSQREYDYVFGFSSVVFGFATPEEFLADPKAYVEFCNARGEAPNLYDFFFPQLSNAVASGEYQEGVYEKDIMTFTADEVYSAWMGSGVPAGTPLILWAAPGVGEEGQADVDEIVYVEYLKIIHEVEVKEVTHSSIILSTNLSGGHDYIIGAQAVSEYNNEWVSGTFEEFMNTMGGKWFNFVQYSAPLALGTLVPADSVKTEVNISKLLGQFLLPGEDYKVWVMPLLNTKSKVVDSYFDEDAGVLVNEYDYSAYDFNEDFLPYVLDVKTNELVAGGTYEATYAVTSAYDAINVNVTLAEGTESVYYYWYSTAKYGEFESDEAVVSDLFENCFEPLTESGVVSKTYLNPGQKFVLASVSIGEDGKYGPVKVETVSTLSPNKRADITVSLISVVDDGTNYVVKVAVSGAARVITYGQNHSATATDTTIAGYKETFSNNTAKLGAKPTYSGYWFADVANGEATLTISKTNFSYKNHLYVNAINVENGIVSSQAEQILAFNIAEEAAKAQ